VALCLSAFSPHEAYFREAALFFSKALRFLESYKSSPLGSWTLINENTMLASGHCESPMPNGEWNFLEDKINPPSRAYLKLWEFFTRFGIHPKKNEICLDLGACPGGWTYVLAGLAKHVFAFDRSPLDERIMALKNVSFKAVDAFKVNLADYDEAQWIFSDVICFPDKLYDFVKQLLERFPHKNFVFTIKFCGPDNKDIISRFASLPGQLVHLSQNKHEITWFKINQHHG
jgi:23S rRNA (cytidine2498-2'-O)-methyltransferase